MKIFIGSDHGGFKTKEVLKKALKKYKVVDVGAHSEQKTDDYPVYAKAVAKAVVKNNAKGILICGTGTGMAMAANKVRGARASFAFDRYSAVMSRKDNDANILTLRGRNFPVKKAVVLAKLWLKTPFSNLERHKRRIKKIE